MSADALVVKHSYSASAERVYDAWLDTSKVGKFLFCTPTGKLMKVEVDARVGGAFLFVDRRDGTDVEHSGRYVELTRPSRIVFEFSVMGSPWTKVTIDIAAKGSGCELTLTHEGVPEKFRERSSGGWTKILAGCAAVVEGAQ